MDLVDFLIQDGWLKTLAIIESFRKIRREDFLPEEYKNLAELNKPLSIGFGQTISQPLTVAFMLELLQPQAGDKILDVGAGSGWTTALLAHIVSQKGNPKPQILLNSAELQRSGSNSKQIINSNKQNLNGKVIAVEIIPEITEFGKNNVEKYGFIENGIVEFICADGSKGFKKQAPYDKILMSAASSSDIPEELKKQLKIGGRMVCPIQNSIWLFVKKNAKEFVQKEYPGFVFVPLV